VCEVPGGPGNVESPRFRLPGPWSASPKEEARKKGFMGKEPSANRIFEIIEPASHQTVASIWRRPSSAPSFSTPPRRPVPAAELQKSKIPRGVGSAKAVGKVCSRTPTGHCVYINHGLISGPLPGPAGVRVSQDMPVDVGQASSALVLSPPFPDLQCPFPMPAATAALSGCALSTDCWAAAGCCSKYACQCRPNIPRLTPCSWVPFGATAPV
jgi:hypothetical protein